MEFVSPRILLSNLYAFSRHSLKARNSISLIALLLISLCSIADPLFADGANNQSTNVSKIELFKNYLEQRPDIKDVILLKRQIPNELLLDEKRPNAKKVMTFQPTELLYHGSWKSNAFFIHEIKDLQSADVITNNLFLAGVNESTFWTEDPHNNLSFIKTGDANRSRNRTNNVYAVSMMGKATLLQGINLGLVVEPYSLKWKNNEFTATFFDPLTDVRSMVTGNLKISNGLPAAIECKIEGSPGSSLLTYEYSSNVGLDYIPNKYKLTIYDSNSNAIPVTEYELLKLTIANQTIPDEYFGPNRFIVSHLTRLITYSNGVPYQISNNLLKPMHPRPPNRAKRVMALVALMLVPIFTILVLMVKTKLRKQIN